MLGLRNIGLFISLVLASALGLLLIAQPASADATASQPQYLLGTTLVLTSPTQLAAAPSGYWGDLLPLEYRFGQCYIVDAINAARKARGESTLVDVTKYPINVGGETQTDKGWEYTLDFQLMKPADVEAALAKFPMSGPFQGLKQDLREVSNGYFYNDSQTDSVTLVVLGQQLEIKASDSLASAREKITALVKSMFGDSAGYDISFSNYSSTAGGTSSMNVSVNVYLNGAQPQYDEHGE